MKPKFTTAEEKAIKMFQAGQKWGVSEFIDEDTIIAGYGGLGALDFKYPLPVVYIRQIYGTTSWKQYQENKKKELEAYK